MPVAEISEAARELKAATGASGLEVFSYNFNTHADVFDLIFELNRIFRRVNFMSQRLDILADSPALAAHELAADKRSFTLGIEGISDRMRRYFRKGYRGRADRRGDRPPLPPGRARDQALLYHRRHRGRPGYRRIRRFAARTAETRRRALRPADHRIGGLPRAPPLHAACSMPRSASTATARVDRRPHRRRLRGRGTRIPPGGRISRSTTSTSSSRWAQSRSLAVPSRRTPQSCCSASGRSSAPDFFCSALRPESASAARQTRRICVWRFR